MAGCWHPYGDFFTVKAMVSWRNVDAVHMTRRGTGTSPESFPSVRNCITRSEDEDEDLSASIQQNSSRSLARETRTAEFGKTLAIWTLAAVRHMLTVATVLPWQWHQGGRGGVLAGWMLAEVCRTPAAADASSW